MTSKVTILFLAANPTDSTKLRLDEEIREIQGKIRAAEFRDSFDLVSRWAVRPLDLLQAFNEVKPHIVHFSGHGSNHSELILEENDGTAKSVSQDALTALFKTVKDNIRLVHLNACHSESQAQAISQIIDCTIGMNTAIGDEAAVTFASTFYGALAFGRSVGQSFEQGRVALMLQGIPEEKTPVLLVRPGVDSLEVAFIQRTPHHPVLPPIALEILRSAVTSNSQLNYIKYDGGLTILAGQNQFDCQFDMEKAALLDHALKMLVQAGWLEWINDQQLRVTHAGFAAVRQLASEPDSGFEDVAKQMPELISEMKKDLERDSGQLIREFFVVPNKRVSLGGSSKPRFIYYEDEHQNLMGKLDILENRGYISDVTPGDTPVYRMTEDFVKLVTSFTTADKGPVNKARC